MGRRMACAERERLPNLRLARIRQDPEGTARCERGRLPELALPADLFPDFGAAFDASLRVCLLDLGCGDAAQLPARRLSDRAPASGNRLGSGIAFHRLEFSCRTKRVS